MSSEVLYRRLQYFMSPQLDIYQHIGPHLAGKRVLDIGFGTGFGTLQLVPYAQSITALEVDSDAVKFAEACIPGVNWCWGDISRSVHYLGKDYDAALLIEVLEHVEDWRAALWNVAEVLKPGGKLYISARNRNADLRKNDLHEREWSAGEFAAALHEYFEDVALYDYRLEEVQDITTRQTPLVAVATKGRKA